MTQHRDMRRKMEDLESEVSHERSKCRQLQRSIDDLNEANEALTRENSQLKSLAALARRSGLNRASTSRFGSKCEKCRSIKCQEIGTDYLALSRNSNLFLVLKI